MALRVFLRKIFGKKRITAHALIQNGDKILLAQEKVGMIRGLWGLPGGGVGKNENFEEAAEREVEEEVGLDIKILKKIGVFDDKKRSSMRHIFLAEVIGGELKHQKKELMDVRWFALEEIKNLNLRGDWVREAVERQTTSSKG